MGNHPVSVEVPVPLLPVEASDAHLAELRFHNLLTEVRKDRGDTRLRETLEIRQVDLTAVIRVTTPEWENLPDLESADGSHILRQYYPAPGVYLSWLRWKLSQNHTRKAVLDPTPPLVLPYRTSSRPRNRLGTTLARSKTFNSFRRSQRSPMQDYYEQATPKSALGLGA